MITLRPSHERGHANFGWLDSHHTFSFGNYYDPNYMGFRALRVINEDYIAPGRGFDTHPHRDMEIVTYVLSGALAHKDTLGNASTIRPNEVQRMSAGTGIAHSEFNPSETEPVHLLQIWILPEAQGLQPDYEEKAFAPEARQQGWLKVVSREGQDGALKINQDVDLYATLLSAGETRSFELRPSRHAWVQIAQGKVSLNGVSMAAGDGAAISQESLLAVQAHSNAEVLLFDLA
ncbi:MAG TPA: pirin family protein [Synechococcales cyanobacterium M55_K2018_004]|nr:pirin family protein [Synechococcales cyanobacterium M55_K2018_004]